MKVPVYKLIDLTVAFNTFIKNAADRVITRMHKTTKNCAGFRRSKRAVTPQIERRVTGRRLLELVSP